jgi:hypothetical protein
MDSRPAPGVDAASGFLADNFGLRQPIWVICSSAPRAARGARRGSQRPILQVPHQRFSGVSPGGALGFGGDRPR